jgi:hypothetical protein
MFLTRFHPLLILASVFTFVLVLPTLYHLSRSAARVSANAIDVLPLQLPVSFLPGASAAHGDPIMPHLRNETVKYEALPAVAAPIIRAEHQ